MPDPVGYVVRFQVLRVECPSLVSGAMYTITCKRGDVTRTSSAISCDSGVLRCSNETFPEVTAVVHFKAASSSSSMRFQPKYITFRIDEAMRSKRMLGEVDCDIVAALPKTSNGGEIKARAVITQDFRMAGLGASLEVVVVIYPEGSTPPPPASPKPNAAGLPSQLVAASDAMAAARAPASHVNRSGATRSEEEAAVVHPQQQRRREHANPSSVPSLVSTRTFDRDDAMMILVNLEELAQQQAAASSTAGENVNTVEKVDADIVALKSRLSDLHQLLDDQHSQVGGGATPESRAAAYARKLAFLRVTRGPASCFDTLKYRSDEFFSDAFIKYFTEVKASSSAAYSSKRGDDDDGQKPIIAKIEKCESALARLRTEQLKLDDLQRTRDVLPDVMSNLAQMEALEAEKSTLQQTLDRIRASAATSSSRVSVALTPSLLTVEGEKKRFTQRIEEIKRALVSQEERLKQMNDRQEVVESLTAWAKSYSRGNKIDNLFSFDSAAATSIFPSSSSSSSISAGPNASPQASAGVTASSNNNNKVDISGLFSDVPQPQAIPFPTNISPQQSQQSQPSFAPAESAKKVHSSAPPAAQPSPPLQNFFDPFEALQKQQQQQQQEEVERKKSTPAVVSLQTDTRDVPAVDRIVEQQLLAPPAKRDDNGGPSVVAPSSSAAGPSSTDDVMNDRPPRVIDLFGSPAPPPPASGPQQSLFFAPPAASPAVDLFAQISSSSSSAAQQATSSSSPAVSGPRGIVDGSSLPPRADVRRVYEGSAAAPTSGGNASTAAPQVKAKELLDEFEKFEDE